MNLEKAKSSVRKLLFAIGKHSTLTNASHAEVIAFYKKARPALIKLLDAVEEMEKLEQQWRDEMEAIKDFTGEAATARRTVLLCADKIREALNLGGAA